MGITFYVVRTRESDFCRCNSRQRTASSLRQSSHPTRRARGRRPRGRRGGLAVGGDSAGANLALAATLALRDTGEPALSFMLLIYGCYSTDTESHLCQPLGRGSGLLQTQMRWIWETYLERPEQRNHWRAQ